MNAAGLVSQAAREYPELLALEYYGESWTFRKLLEQVESLGESLRRWGIASGDRVGIWLGDSPQTLFLYLAALQADATALVFDSQWRVEEVASALSSPLDALVYRFEYSPIFQGALARALRPRLLVQWKEGGSFRVEAALGVKEEAKELPEEGPDAMIVPTSGTTGAPRLVRLSHGNILANIRGLQERVEGWMEPGNVFLNFLPLSHNYGLLGATLMPWSLGCQVVLRRGFNPLEIWELLVRHRVSFFAGVPAVYALLLALPIPESSRGLCLKAACCGSDTLPPEIKRAFEQRFAVPLVEGYSLTEATVVTTMNSPDDPRPGSAGPPLKGIQLKIVDEEERTLEPGEVGEIAVQGPTVMRGYLKPGKGQGKEIRNGWLYTQDLGALDPDGYLRIVGRKNDLIIVGGENVYPAEVEAVCRRFPGVADVAVVGIPDPWMGERPVACVVMAAGVPCDPQAVLGHCAGQLARFKVPSQVLPLPQIPRSRTGKLLRSILRARLAASPSPSQG